MATAARPAARKPAAAKPVAATGKGAGRGGFFRRGKVPAKVLADFTSQLATVVNAGLPLVRCLRILEAQQKPGPFQLVVEAVADDVEGGATLSESLAKYPQVFDRLYINMVRAGEAGGVLGTILERLATFAQKTETIKRQIRSAMIYPIMVLSFAGLVTAFVLAFVVPKFKSIFESFGAEMPTPTLVLMTLSDFILDWWYLLGLVPGCSPRPSWRASPGRWARCWPAACRSSSRWPSCGRRSPTWCSRRPWATCTTPSARARPWPSPWPTAGCSTTWS